MKDIECPACGMNDAVLTGTDENGDNYECRSCGHEWVDDSVLFEGGEPAEDE